MERIHLNPHNAAAPSLPPDIGATVEHALAEDVGAGDLTAALIDPAATATATIITREDGVLCGTAWFDAAFMQLDPEVQVEWRYQDGERITAESALCALRGRARALLTAERTALNFLQTLSGTATITRRYADAIAGSSARILDTRKTLPGLRLAQKYAVRCGGGANHRVGLHDGILIKENHIAAAGSISAAIAAARRLAPDALLEVEVENLAELRQALDAGAPIILLDDFSLPDLREACAVNAGRATLEASGNITLENIRAVAGCGVDYISIGAITKHVHAIDLSMRFE